MVDMPHRSGCGSRLVSSSAWVLGWALLVAHSTPETFLVAAAAKQRRPQPAAGQHQPAAQTTTTSSSSSHGGEVSVDRERAPAAAPQTPTDSYALYLSVFFYFAIVGFLCAVVFKRLKRLRRTNLNASVYDAIVSLFSQSSGSSGRAAAQSGLYLGVPAAIHVVAPYGNNASSGGGAASGVKRHNTVTSPGPQPCGPSTSASAGGTAAAAATSASTQTGGSGGAAEEGSDLKSRLLDLFRSEANPRHQRKVKEEDDNGNEEVAVVIHGPGKVERRS